MRGSVKILLLLLGTVFLPGLVQAQKTATATMRVTVTVLSGATLTDVTPLEMDFNNNEVKGGTFRFTAPVNADTEVTISEDVTLKNQYGEELTLKSDSLHKIENNIHEVDIDVDLPRERNLNGQYTGTVVTTVYYL